MRFFQRRNGQLIPHRNIVCVQTETRASYFHIYKYGAMFCSAEKPNLDQCNNPTDSMDFFAPKGVCEL